MKISLETIVNIKCFLLLNIVDDEFIPEKQLPDLY